MRKRFFYMTVFLLCIILAGCDGAGNVTAYKPSGDTAENSIYQESDPYQADAEPYTGNGSAWCSALFEEPSTKYNNDLALVAAELSERAEDTTGEEIEKLYSEYGIYACETYNYTSEMVTDADSAMEAIFGGGALAIGQDTLFIDGEDTTILVITARGTQTLGEAIGDLFKGWEFSPDKTHTFLDEAVWDNVYDYEEKIWAGLDSYIHEYPAITEAENLKILVTGHSLGGAAANMVAARFTRYADWGGWWSELLDKEDIYAYTFGAIKVLTTEKNVSVGYENIHNIYNYYDSFGPNGNQKGTNASFSDSKFGHTELYELLYEEDGEQIWNSCNSHSMENYIEALETEKEQPGFIDLTCKRGEASAELPEEPPNNSEPETVEPSAVAVDGFIIEGKWKSVGTYGFGQAQPGAVVGFDGMHCNFYSPYDTYAFYEENGEWKLDCTNVLWADTVNFTVQILDWDHIYIYHGSTVTELQRINETS